MIYHVKNMKMKFIAVALLTIVMLVTGCVSIPAQNTPQTVDSQLPMTPSTVASASTPSPTSSAWITATSPTTSVPAASSAPGPIASTPPVTMLTVIANRAFPGTIILGNPTANSITLSLLTQVSLNVCIQYGIVSGKYDSQIGVSSLQKDQPAELKITGLKLDTQYYYRICHQTPGDTGFSASPESIFHTQRTSGDSFVFTIDADPHFDTNSDNNKIDLAFSSISNLKPDFDIDLGDTFMAEKMGNPTSDQVTVVYVQKRDDFGIFGGSVPLYIVTGNHDGGLGTNIVAKLASGARELYYQSQYSDGFYSGVSKEVQLAGPHANYYSWTWGDALFVVLDPFWNSQKDKSGWGMTLGKTQYDWLKSTLEKSQAKYKFVFAHNLVGGSDSNMRGGAEAAKFYEWGGQNTDFSWGFDANRPGWGKPIHQLLMDNHVTIFFHGHDHFYARQEKDEVIYQECPQPGATNPKPHNDEYGYQNGVFLGSAGFIKVTVSSSSVTVDYIKTYLSSEEMAGHKNGEIAYSYTVK
jgi:hypothetical protein